MKRIGLIVKFHQGEATTLALEVGQYLLRKGCGVFFEDQSASIARSLKRLAVKLPKGSSRKITVLSKTKLVESVDMIIVLGGDGTLLSVARLMQKKSVPVLGVNMGQLGFLTEVKKEETLPVLNEILESGKMTVSERTLLEVKVMRKGKTIYTGLVVNDAVVSKGAIARIIEVQVGVNGRWINTIRADGVIVSTPTGSTAYSLAAGGPIVEPKMKALILTPICAHSLTQRPLVLSDEGQIELRLASRPGQVVLTLDGQDLVDMKEEDTVTVRQFKKHKLKLVGSPTRDYFGLLREKLKFGMKP